MSFVSTWHFGFNKFDEQVEYVYSQIKTRIMIKNKTSLPKSNVIIYLFQNLYTTPLNTKIEKKHHSLTDY